MQKELVMVGEVWGDKVGVPREYQVDQYAWKGAQVMGCRDARTISYRVTGL